MFRLPFHLVQVFCVKKVSIKFSFSIFFGFIFCPQSQGQMQQIVNCVWHEKLWIIILGVQQFAKLE